MTSFLKRAAIGAALVATALTVAAPAQAQRYYDDRFGRDRGTDVAVAGLAGLAIGAAIASNNNRFYRAGYYGPRRGFYGPRGGFYGPRGGFYGRGYYGGGRGFYGPAYGGFRGGYGGRCFVQRRFDPYYGAPVRVRVCR